MNRREALAALAAFGTACGPVYVWAQAKVWRIGFLVSGTEATHGALLRVFKEELRVLGYVEGTHYVVDTRWAQGDMARVQSLANELVQARVDLILTASLPLVKAVRKATSSIPIIMASGASPVESGLAASLARPGGNVTGLTNMATETTAKLVELAKQVVPNLSSVALLLSDHPLSESFWNDAQKAAKAFKFTLVRVQVRSAGEIDPAFAAMAKQKVGALVMPADTLLLSLRASIVERAARAKLPAVYPRREVVEAGGLVSYGLNLTEMYRRAAAYVDRIIKGAKPGDLAIEQPRSFELVVNLKTAKALGLKIPQSVLLRADEVIQ